MENVIDDSEHQRLKTSCKCGCSAHCGHSCMSEECECNECLCDSCLVNQDL